MVNFLIMVDEFIRNNEGEEAVKVDKFFRHGSH